MAAYDYLNGFILPYVSDADRKVIGKGGLTIKSSDYDWTLNRQ